MALVGGDDIQVHQDNDDHINGNNNAVNTGNNTDQDQDAAGMAVATGAAGGTGTTNEALSATRWQYQSLEAFIICLFK
jgi:hypothetical protein